jgi:hypothetical protein
MIVLKLILPIIYGMAFGVCVSWFTIYAYRKQFNLNRERMRIEFLSFFYRLSKVSDEKTKKEIYDFLIEQDYYFPERFDQLH